MAPMPITQAMLHEQSLHSSALELKYERSAHLVDLITKDEDIRRFRFDIHILEDDNDELRELLQQEEDRSDAFEALVNSNLARAEEAEAQLQIAEEALRGSDRELATLRAESQALKDVNQESSAVLKEKLALTRELSVLRPQLEHLKAQAQNTEALLAEKLALQRQMSDIQCDLEHAKRETQRALAKRRNTGVEIAQEEQVHELRKELAKEKRERQRAEAEAETAQTNAPADDTRKELAKEKRARQKADEALEAAQEATQVEDVRKDLLAEKRARKDAEAALENAQADLEREKKKATKASKKADAAADNSEQIEEIKAQLAKEKKEHSKAERALQKGAEDWTAQKQVLDDKLNQFRTKLKSTKEQLKESQTALEAAATAPKATVSKGPPAATAAKSGKKRTAAQAEIEATSLGTPGDGPPAKRGKKAANVGDKSTFSITPFLNRTMSVAPDSPAEDENEQSPAATKSAAAKPLAEVPAAQSNIQKPKPRARKPKGPALEMVTEEAEDVHSQGQENAAKAPKEQTLKVKTKTADGTENKSKKAKPRKSLLDFGTYNAEPEPEKKKKRKLGGLGKTLFDEEDEAAPSKAMPGRALFGAKGFGAFGGGLGKAGKGSLLGAKKGGLLSAGDGSGFQFSPLKRSRKNLDDTLRG